MEAGVRDAGQAREHEALQAVAGGKECQDAPVGHGGAGLEVEDLLVVFRVCFFLNCVFGWCGVRSGQVVCK